MKERRKSGGVKRGDDVWIKIKPYRNAPVRGIVKDVLTKKARHPRGIKVRLRDGRIGRVVEGPGAGDEGATASGAFFSLVAVVSCAAGAAWLMRGTG